MQPCLSESSITRYFFIRAGAALAAVLSVIGGVLYQPDEGERAATWSIRRQDARIFFPLLYLLWIAVALALCWAQFAPEPPALLQRITLPPHEGTGAAYSVLARFSAVAIGLAVIAMLLTPIITNTGRLIMTIAQLITRKFVQPGLDKLRNESKAEGIAQGVAQGVAQGIAQGVAQGETQGRAAAYIEFRAWLNRREAAIARGESFSEPAPDEAGNL